MAEEELAEVEKKKRTALREEQNNKPTWLFKNKSAVPLEPVYHYSKLKGIIIPFIGSTEDG